MPQQALVIGLGQFGMAVAQSLTEKGVEVLAIDRDRDLVELAANVATEAIQLDATDEGALSEVTPGKRDLAVCAIGDDSKEASIICTALLRQLGVPRVVARAGNELHARILRLVGAHVVVNPEQEFGQRLANRLIYEKIVSEMPLGSDLRITEFQLPPSFEGQTLAKLSLPRRFGVMVVAVRRPLEGAVVLPDPNAVLQPGDNLIVVSKEAGLSRLMKGA
jgi:trk system potassium uptake protein TrkA